MLKPLFLMLTLVLTLVHVEAQELTEQLRTSLVDQGFNDGERACRCGDHARAISFHTLALQNDADHLNALLQRGSYRSELGEYDLAVADFTEVIIRKPDLSPANTSRSSAFAKRGSYVLAIADLNTALVLDPKNEDAYNNRGWARKANGDLASACKDWNSSKRLGNAEAKIILTNNRCK
jgi:tetratricopeptide (TPR) repeat protein